MPELKVMEPQRKMMTGYAMLEHAILPAVTMDNRSVLQAKVKFEDAFYNRGDKTPLHRGKIAASMEDAARKTVEDPDKLKDTKGIFVYLRRDEGDKTWTARMNEALEKKRQTALADDDIVVGVDSGKRGAQDYVVLRKKTPAELQYQ